MLVRFFVRATIPIVGGNKVIMAGQLGAVIQRIKDELKPDALFFRANTSGPTAGLKSINLVVEADDAAAAAARVEPILQVMQAKIEYEQVLLDEELQPQMASLEAAVKKYGDYSS